MLKEHPKGIMVMFTTEMWERFGFYIMMAILVLYMDSEFGWSDSVKGDHYGMFLGLVYFIPLLGGYLGDKLFGQINTVIAGSVFMLFGYISLALSSAEQLVFFYIGLFLVAFGTGIFKVNMAVLVGNLYKEKVHLKDAGFNIFYMGVNVGATIAPLAATLLGYLFNDYRISFWAAAVGMVIALLTFNMGKSKIMSADVKQSRKTEKEIVHIEIGKTETAQRMVSLAMLFIIVIFFWMAFYQNGFALTLFAERSTKIYDLLRPETYQFFNPFFILVLTPVLLGLFNRLNKKGKEPSTPLKIFIGMTIMGISMVIMVFASLNGGNSDSNIMSPYWLISTYLVVTLAEILISPMGLSYVSKVAPPKLQGRMMGGWYAATAVGSYGSGLLGKYYSDFAHHEYFIILTGILIFSAVLALLSMKKLNRFAN
ncbi:MAG: peptide MFS transporter [Ignavibacteriales bacterium]|nr:peptide MFS transporter [Ignavibacteriota bacterium]MCB9249846.1 peptide MFS transporter [Ignavibacteriales bacterium]